MTELGKLVLDRAVRFVEGLADRPVSPDAATLADWEKVRAFLAPRKRACCGGWRGKCAACPAAAAGC
jgi:hypothetical protein